MVATVPMISKKVLTKQLQQLEADGLLTPQTIYLDAAMGGINTYRFWQICTTISQ